ncbi:hypothetical protein [Herbaspirillum sp. ST 5-3]|uniref:hypothetical protein n=1 Tax=Oxalobacteraceae TaxID=75682 RepID=UPI0010A2BDAA|nr:hypothetical protein [Herbaspirillum sp. ST 5-3]
MFEELRRVSLCVLLGAALSGRAYAVQEGESDVAVPLKLSGYYKNLLQNSVTIVPTEQAYTLDLNRLRLELKGQIHPALSVDVQYDNEILLGSYLRSAQFGLQKDLRPAQYWQAESNYIDSPDVYGRHRLYRAFATLAVDDTDVRVGRQRIAWGTGRFWSPLDILNPISPIQLEREERPGADAILIEHKLGEVSRVSAVYAAQRPGASGSGALYWHANRTGVDFSIVAGRFRGDRLLGADFATQIGNAGLRGELTVTSPSGARHYRRALVGVDYAFANTLTISGEIYYNGAGASDPSAYDFESLLAGRIQNVGQRYAGVFASYEITPLLKTTNYFVANLHDGSRYFAPGLTYSLRTNIDWTIGVQRFSGSASSEYGHFNNVYYSQLQWFF